MKLNYLIIFAIFFQFMSCVNNSEAIDTQGKKSNIEYSGIDSDGGVLELKILNENESFLKLKTTNKVTFYETSISRIGDSLYVLIPENCFNYCLAKRYSSDSEDSLFILSNNDYDLNQKANYYFGKETMFNSVPPIVFPVNFNNSLNFIKFIPNAISDLTFMDSLAVNTKYSSLHVNMKCYYDSIFVIKRTNSLCLKYFNRGKPKVTEYSLNP